MKSKFVQAYMDTAYRFAQLSSAKRLQVGAIVVKDDRIISIGYNGMPAGWDNCCEREVVTEYESYTDSQLVTKPEVLHAEANALTKLAGSNESGQDAAIFITHQPCLECAKLIYQTGIKSVYYTEPYRDTAGVEFLKKCGIELIQLEKK